VQLLMGWWWGGTLTLGASRLDLSRETGEVFAAYKLPSSTAVSNIRLEKPHSLSYQPITRVRAPSTTAVCVESKVHDAGQWLKSMLLLVFAYGGFETALAPMSEAKDPRRDAPFALFTALVVCTVLYALIQWVVVGVLPDAAHSQRPLADVARLAVGPVGAALIAASRPGPCFPACSSR